MKAYLFFALFCLSSIKVLAQSDTTTFFVNQDGRKVKEEKAKLVLKTYRSADTWVKEVLSLNNELQSRESYADEKLLLRNGKSQFYKNGRVVKEGNYYKGQRSGTWFTYNSDGKVNASRNYMLNFLNGDYKAFWSSGKPKVIGTYEVNRRSGEWIFTYENGAIAAKVVYDDKGVAKQSFYHDPNGNPISPESVERKPEFPSGINEFYRFIAERIRYPHEDLKLGTKGDVTCGFTIDENGVVNNVFVISSPSETFSHEAIRVLKLSPKWRAATLFGEPIEVEYTLPINFWTQTTIR